MNIILSIAIIGVFQSSYGATITATSLVNPASVTATLNTSCERAFEDFESLSEKLLLKLSFIKNANHMGLEPWVETESHPTHKIFNKSFNVMITPNFLKEFPTTYLPLTAVKKSCAPKSEAIESDCVNTISLAIDGGKAVIYQKVTEATSIDSYLSSFKASLTLTEASATTCTFTNELKAQNNEYLWIKRHLIEDINPSVVEGRIMTKFVDWTKEILPMLEAGK